MKAESTDLVDRRAKCAHRRVEAWPEPQKTVQVVKGLAVMVRSLGLAQSAAILARRGAPGRRLAEDLAAWLLDQAPMKPLGEGRSDAVGLIERVIEATPQAARAAEEEAIRFLEVLKLFGELRHGDS